MENHRHQVGPAGASHNGHTPHPVPLGKLALASLQLMASAFASECGWGRGDAFSAGTAGLPLQPHSLANAVTPSGKLAKASLLGEGWGEGYDRCADRRS